MKHRFEITYIIEAHMVPQPIHNATLHDLMDIDRIEQSSFKTPWSKELIRGAIYNMRYEVRVLSSQNGGLIGFYISHAERRRSNLDNLAIDMPQRRSGYGSILLNDWIKRSQNSGISGLTLQVSTDNQGARLLYEDYGFEIRRLLRGYYTNGDNAYEMEAKLESEYNLTRKSLAVNNNSSASNSPSEHHL